MRSLVRRVHVSLLEARHREAEALRQELAETREERDEAKALAERWAGRVQETLSGGSEPGEGESATGNAASVPSWVSLGLACSGAAFLRKSV